MSTREERIAHEIARIQHLIESTGGYFPVDFMTTDEYVDQVKLDAQAALTTGVSWLAEQGRGVAHEEYREWCEKFAARVLVLAADRDTWFRHQRWWDRLRWRALVRWAPWRKNHYVIDKLRLQETRRDAETALAESLSMFDELKRYESFAGFEAGARYFATATLALVRDRETRFWIFSGSPFSIGGQG